jgi:hypothetical protein
MSQPDILINRQTITGGIMLISLITAALTVEHPYIALLCIVIPTIAAYHAGRSHIEGRKRRALQEASDLRNRKQKIVHRWKLRKHMTLQRTNVRRGKGDRDRL